MSFCLLNEDGEKRFPHLLNYKIWHLRYYSGAISKNRFEAFSSHIPQMAARISWAFDTFFFISSLFISIKFHALSDSDRKRLLWFMKYCLGIPLFFPFTNNVIFHVWQVLKCLDKETRVINYVYILESLWNRLLFPKEQVNQ